MAKEPAEPVESMTKSPLPAGVAGQPVALAAVPHNIVANLAVWLAALVRPPRAKSPPVPAIAIPAIALTLLVTVAVMYAIDGAADVWARSLPQGFRDVFEHITDLGLGGWILVPAAFVVLYRG
jgi:hypothetical protein